MAVFVNPRDQLLQAASPRVVPIPIDPNTIPGLPGAIAATKGVRISAPSTVFQINNAGVASPPSITMTAILTNVSGPVVWSIQQGTATLTGTGNVRTLAAADMATSSVTIRAMVSFEGSDYIADYTIVKVVDGAPGGNGTPGSNTSLVYAYMRSATTPTTNPGPVTWTFNVAAITTPTTLANGWSKTIPSGTNPIYVTVATATSTTNTDTIAASEWTTPVVLGSQGTNGLSSATVWLFTRSNSSTPPATPAANLTYNFSTGLLSGTLGTWSQTVPLVNGLYLYATTATAASTAATATIAPGAWATPGVLAKDGQDGLTGERGSLDLIGTLDNLTAYPTRPNQLARWSNGTPSAANATSADNAARDVVWLALGNTGTAASNAHLRIGDMVALKNAGESVTVSGYWGGAGWMHPGLILDGNLLVPGTVTANKIDSRGLTIRMPDGTIVLDASRRLQRSDLIDLGVLAALNSVQLGTSQVTGSLPTTNITGLGALAVLNSVNLNTQTTGALNGLTQVTNLGGLAYANAVAANQIGAGAINAGHISAGAVTTTALAAGAVTAEKISVGVSSNILKNTQLASTDGWLNYSNYPAQTNFNRNYPDVNWYPRGENALSIFQDGITADYVAVWQMIIAGVPGKRYCVSAYIASHRCNAAVYVDTYDINYNYISPLAVSGDNVCAATHGGGTVLSGYKRCYMFFTMPSNAATITYNLIKNATHQGQGYSNSWGWFTRPMLEEAGPNQTQPSPFSHSGVGTLITPAGISTPYLSALSSVIGLLRTSTSGQRSELDDNGHRSYDGNNVMRTRLGVW